MIGQEVCHVHGGRSPQAKAAAVRRTAEAKATEALKRAGARPIANPLEELQQLAAEIVTVKDWLGHRVEVLQQLRYAGTGGEQLRGELVAYERALDRCVRVLAEIARLDIDERLVRINAAMATRHLRIGAQGLVQSLRLVFGQAPLPPELREVLSRSREDAPPSIEVLRHAAIAHELSLLGDGAL